MISQCCYECGSFQVKYYKELDNFYCYICENYTVGRVRRWD